MAITKNHLWHDWLKDFGDEKLTRSQFEDQFMGTFKTEPAGLLASMGPVHVMMPVNPFEVRDPAYVQHQQHAQAEKIRRELEKKTPQCINCEMVTFKTERHYEHSAMRESEVMTASCKLSRCNQSKIVKGDAVHPYDLILDETPPYLPEVSADIPESASGDAW